MIIYSPKRFLMLLTITLTICVLAGCYLIGYNTTTPTRWNTPFYIPMDAYKFADSLTIVAWLNDTLFEQSDILSPQDSIFNLKKYEDYHEPRMGFYLKNLSNQNILVKWYDLSLTRYYPNFSRETLGLSFGRGGEVFDDIMVLDGNSLPVDSNYEELRAYDSLVYYYSLDIVPLFDSQVEFVPGSYWIQLVYKNLLWQDTSLPVYIGELKSDTLRFRITE